MMLRRLALAVAAASMMALPAHASETSPAIAGIKLGMTVEEVVTILEAHMAAGKAETGEPNAIGTYTGQGSDGSGEEYTAAKSLVIEYRNRPRGSDRRAPKDRIAVVFGEFNGGRAVAVMRGQSFGGQMPTADAVRQAVKDTYGIAVDQRDAWKKWRTFGMLLRDADGEITDDKNCARTTAGSDVAFGQTIHLAGFSVWNALYEHCGELFRATVDTAYDPAFVNELTQEMIDTQAMIADARQRAEARKVAEDAKRQKALDQAKKITPKL